MYAAPAIADTLACVEWHDLDAGDGASNAGVLPVPAPRLRLSRTR